MSILGEMINTFEMRKKSLFTRETYKYDINNYIDILSTAKDIIIREYTVKQKIKDKDKFNFLEKEFSISHNQIKYIYNYDLEYAYSKIISYFIALELFEIYKIDKEKCFFICDNIITDNSNLQKKLSTNKILLLEHQDSYVRTLKKEYTKYNQ